VKSPENIFCIILKYTKTFIIDRFTDFDANNFNSLLGINWIPKRAEKILCLKFYAEISNKSMLQLTF
jgi:hypothetical protein